MARLAPYLQSLLRMAAACMFIPHGTQKLLAFPVAAPRPGVALMSQLAAARVLELAGGTLMLVGLFSRPVAFVLAGEMRLRTSCRTRPADPGRS